MASCVSALSSIVANGHQVVPTFPPPPLFIPDGEFSPVRLEASLAAPRPSQPSPLRLTRSLRSFPYLAQSPDISVRGCAHRPLVSTVYYPRACKRYYGLMRRSD